MATHKIYDILPVNLILSGDREHNTVFSPMPMVSFRRAKTLTASLVRASVDTSSTGHDSCVGCHRSIARCPTSCSKVIIFPIWTVQDTSQ